MTYRVTSSAWDPESRSFFYTADNLAYRDLMAVNVDTGNAKVLIRDARIALHVHSCSFEVACSAASTKTVPGGGL